MDIIFSASIIAAFLAGMVALFAPCCITVLLPAYLASAFREKKNILKMTFVFFAGIAVILIPIGLGAASLAKIFQSFHRELYILGGFLMIAFAVMAVLGKGLTLPMIKRMMPKTSSAGTSDFKSVFLLGLFSGAATSCCAPVLAGAITLAVVSASFGKAIIITFAYVFGMTFPLFIAAYFYDRLKIENSNFIKGRLWQLKLGSKTLMLHSTNLMAGIIFLAMGIILLILAFFGDAFWAPGYQARIGEFLNKQSQQLLNILLVIPDIVWVIVIIGFFLILLRKIRKNSDS